MIRKKMPLTMKYQATVFYFDRSGGYLRPNHMKASQYKPMCRMQAKLQTPHGVVRDSEEILEGVFRRMNVVDGSTLEVPMHLRCRSMSVGDVVFLPQRGVFFCDGAGWTRLNRHQEFFFRHKAVMAKVRVFNLCA